MSRQFVTSEETLARLIEEDPSFVDRLEAKGIEIHINPHCSPHAAYILDPDQIFRVEREWSWGT